MIFLGKEFVVPGEFLTVEEEYSPGKNTFEDEEGNIYSTKVGEKDFDNKEREVSIKEKNAVNDLIEVGSIVIGKVVLMKDSFMLLEILNIEKNGKKQISVFNSARLRISNVCRSHVNELRDEFRRGDLVKAKVVEKNKFGIEVSTVEREFGVIKAFCSKCRQSLSLFGETLKCSKCGSIEKRKLSAEFK